MIIDLFCFSDSGAELAVKLCGIMHVERAHVHSVSRIADRYGFTSHEKISKDMEEIFTGSDALIFIGASGIAVREIAPYVSSKVSDPAVIVIDDRGRFVISLLSGHIGGANDLARRLADLIGGTAVVTTATDGAGKFACDSWAVTHDCAISSLKDAKTVSASILTEDIPVSSEYPLPEELPSGLVKGDSGSIGIYIGIHKEEPYETTLRLIPRTICVGIGCRRGVSEDVILSAVKSVLKESCIDVRAIGKIVSIDVKKDEEGLLAAARKLGIEPVFYSAEELNSVPGEFDESEFVRKTVGTGNVCERAAALAGGELIVRKTSMEGVTVAASEEKRRIEF